MPDRINKDRFEPAYAQLAAIIRRQIAGGIYPPGEKIPSESTISKQYGLSTMTVRQAVGVLIDQGLVVRIQGSGTFVKPLALTESRFDLDSIKQIFQDPGRIHVKVLQLNMARTDAATVQKLHLAGNARIIVIRRLLLRDEEPIMFHEGRVRCDPLRPLVEAELNLGPLSDLFNGNGGGTAKKGELVLLPSSLDEEKAALLGRPVGTPTFRLEYVVYDFEDVPFGWGWFTTTPEIMSLKTSLGLWEAPRG